MPSISFTFSLSNLFTVASSLYFVDGALYRSNINFSRNKRDWTNCTNFKIIVLFLPFVLTYWEIDILSLNWKQEWNQKETKMTAECHVTAVRLAHRTTMTFQSKTITQHERCCHFDCLRRNDASYYVAAICYMAWLPCSALRTCDVVWFRVKCNSTSKTTISARPIVIGGRLHPDEILNDL